MSKLSMLGAKDVLVWLFFSNPVGISLSLQLDGLNLTLARIATLCSQPYC
jgi:hypothetical protein